MKEAAEAKVSNEAMIKNLKVRTPSQKDFKFNVSNKISVRDLKEMFLKES